MAQYTLYTWEYTMLYRQTFARVPYITPEHIAELREAAERMNCWIVVTQAGSAWVRGPRADEVVKEWGARAKAA